MTEEGTWIDQTLSGDAQAFGNLVRKYQDRLFNSLVHVIGTPEDARDVAQEAFVQAFTKLETFQRQSSFYTWLYRIAINHAISFRRRQRKVASLDVHREVTRREPVDQLPGPAEQLEQQERVLQVQAALQQISDEHRLILILREVDQLDYEEIAQILAVPIGTVRSRLHRARMQLKVALREEFQADSNRS